MTLRIADATLKPIHPAPSLSIARRMIDGSDIETYVPKRFIYGLVPDALLSEYSFFQRSGSHLMGYRTSIQSFPVFDSRKQIQKLNIFLLALPQSKVWVNSEAIIILHEGQASNDDNGESIPSYLLLDLLGMATSTSKSLRAFADTLAKVSSVSHILVWSLISPKIMESIKESVADSLVSQLNIAIHLVEFKR